MKKTLMIMAISNVIIAFSVLTLAINSLSMNTNGGAEKATTAKAEKPQQKQTSSKEAISKKFDNGMTLQKAMKKKKPIAILFYADWCGFCKRFAPLYQTLSKDKELKKQYVFAYVNSEDPENRAFFQEYQIKGFPTLYLYNPENGEKVQVPNSFMFQSDSEANLKSKFQAFLTEGASAIKPPEPKPEVKEEVKEEPKPAPKKAPAKKARKK